MTKGSSLYVLGCIFIFCGVNLTYGFGIASIAVGLMVLAYGIGTIAVNLPNDPDPDPDQAQALESLALQVVRLRAMLMATIDTSSSAYAEVAVRVKELEKLHNIETNPEPATPEDVANASKALEDIIDDLEHHDAKMRKQGEPETLNVDDWMLREPTIEGMMADAIDGTHHRQPTEVEPTV